MLSSITTPPKGAVGTPVAELAVSGEVRRSVASLFAAGRGRELFVLEEVELGVGRPDLLAIATSRVAMEARARRGQRLDTLSEAEILASSLEGSPSRYSAGHQRTVLAGLRQTWGVGRSAVRPAVVDSLIVESKMPDWGSGARQLVRTRWATGRSALAVPKGVASRVDRRLLGHNFLGLISTNGRSARWEVDAPMRPITLLADLWLGELAIRVLESACPQSDSAAANASSATR